MFLGTQTCQQFLAIELERRSSVNPRYSVRAFAQYLGLSPGELSEILRGKRKLSLKAAARVAARLDLNDEERRHLVLLASNEKVGSPVAFGAATDAAAVPLSAEIFAIVSNWFCVALLSLVDTKGFHWDRKWIAKRLGISELHVRDTIARLVRVGMLEPKGRGYVTAKDFHIDPRGIPSEAVRTFHRQMLAKASQALDIQNQLRREITGLTFAVDDAALPAMKKEIGEFLVRFNQRYGRGKRLNSVYQLEVALFQLSQENI